MKPTDPHGSPRRYDDGVVHTPHIGADGHDDLHNEDVAHEHVDVNLRAILASAVVIVVTMVFSWILIYFIWGFLESSAAANQPSVSALSAPATQMPRHTDSPFFSQGVSAPQLLTNEPMVLQKVRGDWAKQLGSYGWVNQSAGVAHVPIDEAKKLLLHKGLPVREGAAPLTFTVRPWVRGEGSGGRTVTVDLPERTDSGAPAAPAEHGAAPHGGEPAAKPQGGH